MSRQMKRYDVNTDFLEAAPDGDFVSYDNVKPLEDLLKRSHHELGLAEKLSDNQEIKQRWLKIMQAIEEKVEVFK